MSTKKGRPSTGRPSRKFTAAKQVSSATQSSLADDSPALFDTVTESHPCGRTTTLVPSEYVTGPGPRPATTGPQDAEAPAWWVAEAELKVLALIDAGHCVTADDLRERYPQEPSATGAAIGALFARLSRAGRIREVGWAASRRPEARGRRVILWGAAR